MNAEFAEVAEKPLLCVLGVLGVPFL